MEVAIRRRLDAEAWGAVLERFEQSGLSVAQFCEREGLGTASFYRWRSILELGAEHVGIIQSLVTTCRLQSIDFYTYLVDVLQRVGQHPASRVAELTPRLWKQHFGVNPLRSDLQLVTQDSAGLPLTSKLAKEVSSLRDRYHR